MPGLNKIDLREQINTMRSNLILHMGYGTSMTNTQYEDVRSTLVFIDTRTLSLIHLRIEQTVKQT